MNTSKHSTPLHKHLADARQRLVQTGTRNRLVHAARFARQGKAIDIVDERSEDIFRILRAEGRRMRFAHDPSVRESKEEHEPTLAPISLPPDEDRFTDLALQTRFGQDRLQKKLLNLAREARTLEEEQGINALYLALGFLNWFEDERSEVARTAPLILLPVSLRRNERTSTYDLEIRDEDIATNEPLKYRLADDFGIALPDIPETDDWTPASYFDRVTETITGKGRWSIDRDGMQVGFFSFAKLLMVRDLEPENWPTDITERSILAGLLMDGFATEKDDFSQTDRLDQLFTPSDLVQVLDADASQTLVIETVRRGRNLVVQGPPGTGKSQTITNIIAAAAHDGKSVLFMAEKMAALNVVHERLKASGLRDICLELHSRSANKRLVAEELGRTLNAPATTADAGDVRELTQLRDRLNRVADVMHRPVGETDVTPFRAVSTLIRLGEENFVPDDIELPGVQTWSREQLGKVLSSANALASITARAGARMQHPFFGVRRLDLLPGDRQRLKPRLEALVSVLDDADRAAASVTNALGIDAPRSPSVSDGIAGIVELVATLAASAVPFASAIAQHGGIDRASTLAEAGQRFVAVREGNAHHFRSPAWTAQIDHLRPMLMTGHGLLGRLGSPYRRASAELGSLLSGPLPKKQPERIALLDRLAELQQSKARLLSLESLGIELLDNLWQGEDTDFANLFAASTWLGQLLKSAVRLNATSAVGLRRFEPAQLSALRDVIARKGADARARTREVIEALDLDLEAVFGVARADDIAFDHLAAWVQRAVVDLERLDEWSQLHAADTALRVLAGDHLADAIGSGSLAPAAVRSTVRYIHAEAVYRRFAASEAWATNLTAAEKAELVEGFRERENARRISVAQLIRGEHLARLPRGGMGAMGLVRGEIGKKRGHKPIRRLIVEAGSTIQQIKPVMLMSPISVAQFLPPGALEFDLLVIDEASQVRPEDALGAIARAKQIVVVGDKRQLPPTSFFDRIVSDTSADEPEEEDEISAPVVTSATELESILTLCEARGMASRMLRWHYRSRHPSLIEVSNEVFYQENGGLILFPSPAATREHDGLTLTRINGAYDRGGKRHNVIEADAVAEAVAAHAAKSPNRSLGVVTFSSAQRDAITERLAALRLGNNALDAFMREGINEEFFVKNIENVQGDERDVIFISVGYGPRIAGSSLDSMAFGPVSTEGGERRLNVLFTRARFRTQVFCSFNSADINLERTKSAGARVLKRFLHYAETGEDVRTTRLDEDPDSDFEVSVAAEIRRLGYEVDHQVGSSGFKIDLAVHRPHDRGRYMLAVECDGATYHSAVWARERDRLRQEVLEGLGWRFHRVWSTDWFHRRTDEVRRLKAALLAAAVYMPVPGDPGEPDLQSETDTVDVVVPQGIGTRELPDYALANFPVSLGSEPHEVPAAHLALVVQKVIDIEGPVHREEIARRVAALFGKQRTGSRIVEATDRALHHLRRNHPDYLDESGFWITRAAKANVPLRNRSRAPLTLRRAPMLPPAEIAMAIRQVITDNGALSREELPRATALLFGFERTGPEFRPAIMPVIEIMLASGELQDGARGIELVSS